MKTDDNRCRECGAHLREKYLIEVGLCHQCAKIVLSSYNEAEEEDDNEQIKE